MKRGLILLGVGFAFLSLACDLPEGDDDLFYYDRANLPFCWDSVARIVNYFPGFPGGDSARTEFLQKNLRYPFSFGEGIGGRVECGFIINEDGTLSHIGVLRGVHPDLDREAVRVIKEMALFRCAKPHGRKIKMFCTFTVSFNHFLYQSSPADREQWKVYEGNMLDQMPEFPGGDRALLNYINKNLRYPLIADQNIQGRVVCRFIVHEDGRISDVEIIRGIDQVFDEEALKVVYEMPAWTPGKRHGQAVKSYYLCPVVFRLY